MIEEVEPATYVSVVPLKRMSLDDCDRPGFVDPRIVMGLIKLINIGCDVTVKEELRRATVCKDQAEAMACAYMADNELLKKQLKDYESQVSDIVRRSGDDILYWQSKYNTVKQTVLTNSLCLIKLIEG